jgi:diaminohydroxyphosphoribosylaminopyrimidine deaminase/5-amino-6-(5-phosphoribosylamino)uracil reductase
MKYCFNDNIQSIIVEGGKKTIQNFIDVNLWDESRVFTSNKKLNRGILAPRLNSEVHSSENFDGDKLNFYFN